MRRHGLLQTSKAVTRHWPRSVSTFSRAKALGYSGIYCRHPIPSLTLPGIIALKRRKTIGSVHPHVAFRSRFMVRNSAPPLTLFWCHLQRWSCFCLLNMIIKEKTAPSSKVAPFSKTAPGWSRFGSTFFLSDSHAMQTFGLQFTG